MTMGNRLVLAALLVAVVRIPATAAEGPGVKIADEGGSFTLASASTVIYGAGSTWTAPQVLVPGVHSCSNATFGDPINGTVKECRSMIVASPPPPACWPDLKIPLRAKNFDVDPRQFDGESNVAVWTCRTATGLKNEVRLWSLGPSTRKYIDQGLAGQLDEAGAREAAARDGKWAAAEAQEKALQLVGPYLASAKVSASGTAKRRSVYAMNPDGTRNPTAVPGSMVGVGTPCDIGDRIGNTNYFGVEGRSNVAVEGSYPPLGRLYAPCTLSTPVGVNE